MYLYSQLDDLFIQLICCLRRRGRGCSHCQEKRFGHTSDRENVDDLFRGGGGGADTDMGYLQSMM
jgi:hypothetical protein